MSWDASDEDTWDRWTDAKRCYECDALLTPLATPPYYCSQTCRDAAGADDDFIPQMPWRP